MDKIWRWLLFTVKVLVTMFIASFLCAMIFAVVYTWMDFSWGWHLNLLSDTSVEEVWGLAILAGMIITVPIYRHKSPNKED